MEMLKKAKEPLKARIGVYSTGLNAYWEQFPGLLGCLTEYNSFIAGKLSGLGDVFNFGMVDTEEKGREAGEYFSKNSVDIVFCHVATYCISACILPVHRINKAPAVILNLQPAAEMAYMTTGTDRWLAQCVACAVPEISNAMNRAGIPFRAIITEKLLTWVKQAAVLMMEAALDDLTWQEKFRALAEQGNR